MNIIKFKDMVRTGDAEFNSALKGRYAYWIHMRYVIPLNAISISDYVRYENNICELINWRERHLPAPEVKYWDILGKHQDLQAWVDDTETDLANSINIYNERNNHVTDAELTTDQVKKFRTWLAKRLLAMDAIDDKQLYRIFSQDTTEMLQYYANKMFDDTCRRLFKVSDAATYQSLQVGSCGCGSSNASTLYGTNASLCEPLNLYKRYMYSEMCKKFSDMDFWADMTDVFMLEFKKYIDNILNLELPLTTTQYTSNLVDCVCANSNQFVNADILRRLSQALAYMADRDLMGHKNFISKALRDWSENLYETMEWP